MARETFKKVITSEEKWAEVNSKNKKLMEQEKRFIPSFDMRWN